MPYGGFGGTKRLHSMEAGVRWAAYECHGRAPSYSGISRDLRYHADMLKHESKAVQSFHLLPRETRECRWRAPRRPKKADTVSLPETLVLTRSNRLPCQRQAPIPRKPFAKKRFPVRSSELSDRNTSPLPHMLDIARNSP